MSRTKEYIAEMDKREALQDVLKILLGQEKIQHEASKGIARKIIDKGNIDDLSDKQLFTFEKHIKPFIDVSCTKEGCGQKIDILDLAEAYESEEFYCRDCSMDMDKMASYLAR